MHFYKRPTTSGDKQQWHVFIYERHFIFISAQRAREIIIIRCLRARASTIKSLYDIIICAEGTTCPFANLTDVMTSCGYVTRFDVTTPSAAV